MLEHDKVDLSGTESELLLEQSTESVEHVASGSDLPVREETEGSELRDEEVGVLLEGVELLQLEDDTAGEGETISNSGR